MSKKAVNSTKQIGHGSLIKSKKDGKDQETIQSSTTHDPGYHMGK